jgi:hypothetical protein
MTQDYRSANIMAQEYISFVLYSTFLYFSISISLICHVCHIPYAPLFSLFTTFNIQYTVNSTLYFRADFVMNFTFVWQQFNLHVK